MNIEQIEVNVEEVSPVAKKVAINISSGVIGQELENKLVETCKKATVKGFRPGKAPREIVEKMYGGAIQSELLGTLAEKALSLVIKDKKLDVVTIRDISFKNNDLENGISYSAELALYPSPEVKEFDEVQVELKEVTVTDQDLDKSMKKLQEAHVDFEPLAFREDARKDDLVDIALTIKEEGSETDLAPERAPIRLGEGRLPKEVEDALIGGKVGETKEVTVKAGDKSYLYKVVIEGIKQPKERALDDDFAQKINPALKTLLELRMDLRKYLESESEKINTNLEEQAVVNHLLEKFPFEVPVELTEQEVRYTLESSKVITEKDPIPELNPELKKQIYGEAEKRVKAAYLLSSFAKELKVQVGDEDIQNYVTNLSGGDPTRQLEMQKVIGDRPELVRQIAAQIVQKKSIDKLKEKIKFNKKQLSFHDYNDAEMAKNAGEEGTV